ncbi:hypothetical protein CYLTODRAFT_420386 [Cylindrobasidium torrendii FP15055 ss-10]|uniref:Uncharacterized protein n=1 Tax=Cylindrobasidium torrendii FP15055 ss-10 TaxID=1314674 RepID=A0A0D7BJB2_9AGAR|nr:hypothetical protein CYLTODRAFT_420386 [Cylindrobasidium torrendii FP15055 ss-10]
MFLRLWLRYRTERARASCGNWAWLGAWAVLTSSLPFTSTCFAEYLRTSAFAFRVYRYPIPLHSFNPP